MCNQCLLCGLQERFAEKQGIKTQGLSEKFKGRKVTKFHDFT